MCVRSISVWVMWIMGALISFLIISHIEVYIDACAWYQKYVWFEVSFTYGCLPKYWLEMLHKYVLWHTDGLGLELELELETYLFDRKNKNNYYTMPHIIHNRMFLLLLETLTKVLSAPLAEKPPSGEKMYELVLKCAKWYGRYQSTKFSVLK